MTVPRLLRACRLEVPLAGGRGTGGDRVAVDVGSTDRGVCAALVVVRRS